MTRPRMDIQSAPGTKVVLDAQMGYQTERQQAQRLLQLDGVYTVAAIHIGQAFSRVRLEEYKGLWFNTLLFGQVDKEASS